MRNFVKFQLFVTGRKKQVVTSQYYMKLSYSQILWLQRRWSASYPRNQYYKDSRATFSDADSMGQ